MTLNGTLEDFSPAGILKVLSADSRTGAVRFGGPYGCTVYLHRGQLYFARNEGTDEALATALVRPGRLTADDWGRAIDGAGDRPMVGELLVRDGAISPDLLASVVLSVVYDPLIELFRDGTGEFEFEPDTVHWLGPFRAFPVDAIMGEVRKRVREADEWADAMPGLDVWVEASRTLPGNAAQVTILREDWELVTALSGPRTIRELAIELGRGAYSTARVVHRLHQAGLVEVVVDDVDADVVPIRRRDPMDVPSEFETDPLLSMGLPHRTAKNEASAPADALTAHIGDAIAGALADPAPAPDPGILFAGLDLDAPAEPLAPVPDLVDDPTEPVADDPEAADDGFSGRWDASRRIHDDHGPMHHDVGPVTTDAAADPAAEVLQPEDLAPDTTSLDDARPTDPNAIWLADLYSQFIDEPENGGKGKRRRGEPNPVDVAFKTDEQDGEAKVSTLKRLMTALKKL